MKGKLNEAEKVERTLEQKGGGRVQRTAWHMVQSRCSDESGRSQDECKVRTDTPHAPTGPWIFAWQSVLAPYCSRMHAALFKAERISGEASLAIWAHQDLSPEVERGQLLQQALSHAAFVAFVLYAAVCLKRSDSFHRCGLSDTLLGTVLLALSLIWLFVVRRRVFLCCHAKFNCSLSSAAFLSLNTMILSYSGVKACKYCWLKSIKLTVLNVQRHF